MKKILIGAVASMLIIAISVLFMACEKDTMKGNGDATSQNTDLSTHFKAYEIVTLDTKTLFEAAKKVQAQGTGSIEIADVTTAKLFCKLNVVPNDLFEGKSLSVIAYGNKMQTQKSLEGIALSGAQGGNNFSEARLFVTPDFVGGFWNDKGVEFHIEALQMYNPKAAANQFVVHKATDEIVPANNHCEALASPTENNGFQDISATGTANCWKMEVFCDGDFEYYRDKCGSNFDLAVWNIAVNINNTDAKFAAIGLDLVIVGIGIYTDPAAWWYYPTSTNISTLLNQFANFHNYFHANTNRDTWLLFTGKDVGRGIAWLSVICNNKPYSYAVMQWLSSSSLSVETAHEIGHNLGAKHPNNDPSSSGYPAITCYPATAAQSGIMYSFIQPGTQFSSCSNSQMQNHLWYNANSCMTSGTCN